VRLLVLLLLMLCLTPLARAQTVEAPGDYRLDDYHAPVPASVPGAEAIDTAMAERLWRDGRTRFIDVLPAPRRPEGMRPEAIWKPLPHRDIPGSLWLPEVGRGAISPELDAKFREGLAAASGDDLAAPLVIYCRADCWMSWNAAKRASTYGYTRLYWYRDGTDGWEKAALPLAEVTPRF